MHELSSVFEIACTSFPVYLQFLNPMEPCVSYLPGLSDVCNNGVGMVVAVSY